MVIVIIIALDIAGLACGIYFYMKSKQEKEKNSHKSKFIKQIIKKKSSKDYAYLQDEDCG